MLLNIFSSFFLLAAAFLAACAAKPVPSIDGVGFFLLAFFFFLTAMIAPYANAVMRIVEAPEAVSMKLAFAKLVIPWIT